MAIVNDFDNEDVNDFDDKDLNDFVDERYILQYFVDEASMLL